MFDTSEWLAAVADHPETIDTDVVVGEFLAQEPDRLWSLTDVLSGLQHDRELEDLEQSLIELVDDGFLYVELHSLCDEPSHDGGPGNHCSDPLCVDMLFRIRHP